MDSPSPISENKTSHNDVDDVGDAVNRFWLLKPLARQAVVPIVNMAPRGTRGRAVVFFKGQDIRMLPTIVKCSEMHVSLCPLKEKTLSVYAISAGRCHFANDEKTTCRMELNFWAREGVHLPSGMVDTSKPSCTITVLTPAWWTPKIYLAAVLHKLKWHKEIWLSNVASYACIKQQFDSVLDVHWLYGCNRDELCKILTDGGTLVRVEGGDGGMSH